MKVHGFKYVNSKYLSMKVSGGLCRCWLTKIRIVVWSILVTDSL